MTINWEKENKQYKVGDKCRTSELSHHPGGVKVFVNYKKEYDKVYDKAKYPDKYINTIADTGVEE